MRLTPWGWAGETSAVHNIVVAAFLLMVGAPGPEFEGLLEMKMTMPNGGGGTIKLLLGKAGARTEMEVVAPQMQGQAMHMSFLMKKDNPDVAYGIDDARKTYAEINIKQQREMARSMSAKQKYTAKKIGNEKVLGYDCVHAKVTNERGEETDVWTNKTIMDQERVMSAFGGRAPADEGMLRALKDAGADGFFVKLVHKSKDGGQDTSVELVKAEKKALPDSTFEIPSGYTKQEGPAGMGQLTPEQRQQLMQQMLQKEKMKQQQQQSAPH
jgi:hypothetical protein